MASLPPLDMGGIGRRRLTFASRPLVILLLAGPLTRPATAGPAQGETAFPPADALKAARPGAKGEEPSAPAASKAGDLWRPALSEALRWAEQLEGSLRVEACGAIAAEWARRRPEDAAGWASRIKDARTEQYALQRIAWAWAESDPGGAAELAGKIGTDPVTVVVVAGEWAKRDPGEAADWADRLEGTARDWAFSAVAREQAETDLDAATGLIRRIGDSSLRAKALASLAEECAKKDPLRAAGFAALIDEEHIDIREVAFEFIAREWARKDPTATWDWVQETVKEPVALAWALACVLEELAKLDPEEAVKRAEVVSKSGRLPKFLVPMAVARGWAEKDPAAAAEWAMGTGRARGRDSVLSRIAEKWAETDPGSSWALARKIDNSEIRGRTFAEIARVWAGKEPREALAAIKAIEDDSDRDGALAGVVESWAEKDARKAAEFLPKIGGVFRRNRAFRKVAKEWAKKDAPSCYRWAARREGSAREKVNAFLGLAEGLREAPDGVAPPR